MFSNKNLLCSTYEGTDGKDVVCEILCNLQHGIPSTVPTRTLGGRNLPLAYTTAVIVLASLADGLLRDIGVADRPRRYHGNDRIVRSR